MWEGGEEVEIEGGSVESRHPLEKNKNKRTECNDHPLTADIPWRRIRIREPNVTTTP